MTIRSSRFCGRRSRGLLDPRQALPLHDDLLLPFAARTSCPFRLPVLSGLSLHILPKRSINSGLITFFGSSLRFEPSDHVGVHAQRQLLLQRPIEKSAFSARPVEHLWSVRRVDSIIGQSCKHGQFCELFRLQRFRSSLLHNNYSATAKRDCPSSSTAAPPSIHDDLNPPISPPPGSALPSARYPPAGISPDIPACVALPAGFPARVLPGACAAPGSPATD
jgi:hypothetical protein